MNTVASTPRHLLGMVDLLPADLWRLLKRALALKRDGTGQQLAGRQLALLFEKPSLRTRVSFEIAMRQLGGNALYLSPAEVGLGLREPVADVARVLSRYVDGIVARTFSHDTVQGLAQFASVPVINGLSDREHPCQALADLLTIHEHRGRLDGLRLAFVGDGNNVACSLMLAGAMAGMEVRLAIPAGYEPPADLLDLARARAAATGGQVTIVRDPRAAAAGVDVLYTDVWTSMGQEAEREARLIAFVGYQVNVELIGLAAPDVIVMHDLPAHRGEEIADEAIEGPHSVVFDQAENRLHAQKAVLVELLGGADR